MFFISKVIKFVFNSYYKKLDKLGTIMIIIQISEKNILKLKNSFKNILLNVNRVQQIFITNE